MATLFDVLLHCARALDALHEGVATSGSVTACVDSTLSAWGWQDDDYNQGTLLWITDVSGGGGGLASRVVSDFTRTSGDITVSPAFSVSVQAGDLYGVMTKRYPRYVMLGKINEALAELGEILSTQDISATGAREYALAATYKRIAAVHIGDSTANPQDWYREAMYQHAEGRLLFDREIDTGKTIRVYYLAPHAALAADADVLNADINPDWLGISAAMRCARWRLQQPGADVQSQTTLINDLMVREASARARRRVWRPSPATNIFPLNYPEW